MVKFHTFLLLLSLAACSSVPSSSTWSRYTFDLSGRTFSVSAPTGHFRDQYLPRVDLATNENSYVTLLQKAWVFSGMFADQGGMDFIVGLNRAELGSTEDDFLRGLKKHLSEGYQAIRPEGVQLNNITTRQIGGREWLCYSISNISAECALRVDARHYVSWRLLDINNSSSRIDSRDQLRKKIENSLEIKF